MSEAKPKYHSLSSWLKTRFGESVRKISIDAGLGCPNRDGAVGRGGCIYCNSKGSGTGAVAQGLSIREQVDRGIDLLSRRYGCRKFIAYFQSFTNTYATLEHLSKIYSEALTRAEVVGLAIGTRPDCVPEPVLDLLAQLARERLVWIEYGLQSIHARTLELINRGHGSEVFYDAVDRTRNRGIPAVVHLVLGLPGESLDDMRETARAVAGAGVRGVKLHPLYVIKGSELEKLYLRNEYIAMTESEAIQAIIAVLELLPWDVVVHRMTSDPHPEELVAPLWMLDRRNVRRNLEKTMSEINFRQGSLLELPSTTTQKPSS